MSIINAVFGTVGLGWGLKGLLAKPAGPSGPEDVPPPETVDGQTPPPLQQSATSEPMPSTGAPIDG